MFMSLFGFGIGMMFASFHLYLALWSCCFCYVLLPLGLVLWLVLCWLSLVLVFPIYVSVSFVCFAFDCVGELFVECVCYLCG